jgi:DNA-binding CsgD family transcriptional regulator
VQPGGGHVLLDDRCWPLVVTQFSWGLMGDDVLERYLARFDELLARDRPFALLSDTSRATVPPSARQLAVIEGWSVANAGRLRRLVVIDALVVSSTLVWGVVTAYYSVKRPPRRHEVFRSRDAAVRRCAQVLAAHRLLAYDAASELPRRVAGFLDPLPPRAPVPRPPLPPPPHELGPVLDMFEEPAFLLSEAGKVVHANLMARRLFPRPPSWLAATVDPEAPPLAEPYRSTRLEVGARSLYLVIPCDEVVPSRTPSAARDGPLTPSLRHIATLAAAGRSDKEIAQESGLSVASVRTYVRRIYERLRVHSRVELVERWKRLGRKG